MNLNPLIQAQIDGRLLCASYVLRIDTDPPVRAWTGAGIIMIDAEAYLGLGTIPDVPAFQSLVNGVASRLDLSLSGVDAQVMSLANGDAAQVRGKEVKVGLIFLDNTLQPIGSPFWVGPDYEADVITTESVSTAEFGRARTVTLSVGSTTTGRRRPLLNYWTRAQQIIRSATDAFCDLVSRYTSESEMKWPP
jgi:hypothetical protein